MSIPMSIMYGHNLESLDDPFIVAAEEQSTMAIRLVQPGYTLINILPFLGYIPWWFPGATTQKMIKKVKGLSDMLRISPMETVKRQLVSISKPLYNHIQYSDGSK